MNAALTAIVHAYEELHLSVEDIAETYSDFDVSSIKAVLMSHSPVYRDAYRKENPAADFTESDCELFTQTMKNILMTTDDENLKFRIAKFGRNDFKGRLDVAKNTTGLITNVLEFNQQLMRARLSINKSKGMIEVESAEQTQPAPVPPSSSEVIQEAELVSNEEKAA